MMSLEGVGSAHRQRQVRRFGVRNCVERSGAELDAGPACGIEGNDGDGAGRKLLRHALKLIRRRRRRPAARASSSSPGLWPTIMTRLRRRAVAPSGILRSSVRAGPPASPCRWHRRRRPRAADGRAPAAPAPSVSRVRAAPEHSTRSGRSPSARERRADLGSRLLSALGERAVVVGEAAGRPSSIWRGGAAASVSMGGRWRAGARCQDMHELVRDWQIAPKATAAVSGLRIAARTTVALAGLA